MFSEQKLANLVFIPFPVPSHLGAALQTAGLLVERDPRLSITIIVLKLPVNTGTIPQNSSAGDLHPNIRFVELPRDDSSVPERGKSPVSFIVNYINSQKGLVRDAVKNIPKESPDSGRVAAFVLDEFCVDMVDVANELGLPSYIFLTCSASSLGLNYGLQDFSDRENKDLTDFENSEFEISLPTYLHPVPAKVWPPTIFQKDRDFLGTARKFRETKGVVVNTFLELEPRAIQAMSDDEKCPPVYPIGPIIQPGGEGRNSDEIIKWLDGQPNSSVVFVCFGTIWSFKPDQLTEIAEGLEKSGQRFLWSLRKKPEEGKLELPGEYENPEEVLPQGFLERTAGIGKVIGWAPQMAILSHCAVGGFVSHCGWNSILETVWCGIPVAVWPQGGEQQVNAFQLVRELGIAVDIQMDYNNDSGFVSAEKIEKGVRELMMGPEKAGPRAKVRALSERSRTVMSEGGSSYHYLGRFIDSVFDNKS